MLLTDYWQSLDATIKNVRAENKLSDRLFTLLFMGDILEIEYRKVHNATHKGPVDIRALKAIFYPLFNNAIQCSNVIRQHHNALTKGAVPLMVQVVGYRLDLVLSSSEVTRCYILELALRLHPLYRRYFPNAQIFPRLSDWRSIDTIPAHFMQYLETLIMGYAMDDRIHRDNAEGMTAAMDDMIIYFSQHYNYRGDQVLESSMKKACYHYVHRASMAGYRKVSDPRSPVSSDADDPKGSVGKSTGKSRGKSTGKSKGR